MKLLAYWIFSLAIFAAQTAFAGDTHRITSVYLSQDFINEQLKAHVKSTLITDPKIEFNSEKQKILFTGLLQIPTEEMKAVNLDPSLGAFRFQLSIKPETTPNGYLILDFPLNETYFYPANSKDPKGDRVFIPVQMLSLGLASARGYFAALSGDFSSFDRRTAKLKALLKQTKRAIATEKNPDALDELKTQEESQKLQIAAIPIERKQLQAVSKEVSTLMAFTGEKELNLNDDFAARKNALIIKLDLQKLTPFLSGVELGGVRMVHDKKYGKNGVNYLSIDINAQAPGTDAPLAPRPLRQNEDTTKTAPMAVLRLNQSLFESQFVTDAEKKSMGSKITDLKIDLKEDGLHVAGVYHKFIFSVSFDTVVDFVTTGLDTFEIRVRDVEVAGIDLEFMTGFVLEALKAKLDNSLKGMCSFKYMGQEGDRSRAMQVTMNPSALVPALPGLHLVDVDIREREFLLKIGHASN